MDTRRVLTAKGKVTSTARGRNGALHNPFAGLVRDGNFDLPMHWQDKGKRSRPKLATYSKETNGKTPNTIPYADFEAAFLTWLGELDWASVIDAADSEEIKALEAKIGSLDLAIGRDTQRVETIIDSLVDLPSPALKARLAATESALAAAKSERRFLSCLAIGFDSSEIVNQACFWLSTDSPMESFLNISTIHPSPTEYLVRALRHRFDLNFHREPGGTSPGGND